MNDFIRYMRDEVQWSTATIDGYTQDLKDWTEFLGRPMEEATRPDARAYLAFLKNKEFKPTTIRRKIAAAKALYDWMVSWEKIEFNPFSNLDLPKLPKRQPKFLHVDEVDRLLAFPSNGPLDIRDKSIISLLFGTGIRVQELETLDIDHVDMDRRELTVVGKGDKERTVPFGDVAADWLSAYLPVRKQLAYSWETALFVSSKGTRLKRRGVQLIIQKLAEIVLGKDVSPHWLRHSLGQAMADDGADYVDIADILGHSSVNTTRDFYVGVSTSRLHRALDEHHPHAKRKEFKLRVLAGGKA